LNHDAQLVTVAVGDPEMLRTASRQLDEAGITVSELALRRPSLDEVFFALTGRPADGDQSEQPDTDQPQERSAI
jgi:oleandomycin transport system ATP-binding protein